MWRGRGPASGRQGTRASSSGTLGPPIRQTSFDDSRREPIAVLRLFDEVVNAHDATAIEGFTTNPTIAGELDGLLDAFPDLHFDVTWTVAEQDRVVAFLEMSGTHEGSWLMVQEGTHHPVRASIMLCLQLNGHGMVIDSSLGTNYIAMLAQVGWGVAPEASETRPDLTEPRSPPGGWRPCHPPALRDNGLGTGGGAREGAASAASRCLWSSARRWLNPGIVAAEVHAMAGVRASSGPVMACPSRVSSASEDPSACSDWSASPSNWC